MGVSLPSSCQPQTGVLMMSCWLCVLDKAPTVLHLLTPGHTHPPMHVFFLIQGHQYMVLSTTCHTHIPVMSRGQLGTPTYCFTAPGCFYGSALLAVHWQCHACRPPAWTGAETAPCATHIAECLGCKSTGPHLVQQIASAGFQNGRCPLCTPPAYLG